MCLDCLFASSNAPVSGVGFKRIYLTKDGQQWRTLFNGCSDFDIWLEAECPDMSCKRTTEHYAAGFHIYRSRDYCLASGIVSPSPFCVVEVEYKDLICVGFERRAEVIISRRMRVNKASLSSMEGREIKEINSILPANWPVGVWFFDRRVPCPDGGVPVLWDVNTGEVLFIKE